jgi:AcrR family transcriptional regulator
MAHAVSVHGDEQASVERVLELAGVSRRTFYELFADREDCYLAAYDEAIGRAFALVTAAYLDCESPERRIEAALEAFLDFCADEPQVARMCLVEVFAAGARARERRAQTMERMAALMEHALGELTPNRRLDRLSARALVGGVHEVIYGPVDRGETEILRGLAHELVESQIKPLAAG